MQILKKIYIIFLNYILILYACLFYKGGAPLIFPLFIIIQIIIVSFNYKIANTKFILIFFNINLLISTIVANKLSTYLYYNNISSDSDTLAVGNFGLMVGIIFVLIISFISILLKKKKSYIKDI